MKKLLKTRIHNLPVPHMMANDESERSDIANTLINNIIDTIEIAKKTSSKISK